MVVILPGLNGRLMGDHQVMDGGDSSENMVISMGISLCQSNKHGVNQASWRCLRVGCRHIELVVLEHEATNKTWRAPHCSIDQYIPIASPLGELCAVFNKYTGIQSKYPPFLFAKNGHRFQWGLSTRNSAPPIKSPNCVGTSVQMKLWILTRRCRSWAL